MTRHSRIRLALGTLTLALSLAACQGQKPEDPISKLDNELVSSSQARQAKDADPALVAALDKQIMVDPTMTGPAAPPPALAADECAGGNCPAADEVKAKPCDRHFARDPRWATRLPAGLPVYPGAKVTDAAGNDTGDCHIRIVSFSSLDAPQKLIDYYFAQGTKGGYDPEHQLRGTDHIIAGARMPQGDAFHVTISPRGDGGSNADLIANHGN